MARLSLTVPYGAGFSSMGTFVFSECSFWALQKVLQLLLRVRATGIAGDCTVGAVLCDALDVVQRNDALLLRYPQAPVE